MSGNRVPVHTVKPAARIIDETVAQLSDITSGWARPAPAAISERPEP